MKKKIISLLIIASTVIAILLGTMISYANEDNKPLIVNLQSKYANGVGYGFFNPNTTGGKYIWKVVSYDDDGAEEKRNLYCVKGEYGKTWNDTPSQKLTYDLQYNFQTDRDFIEQSLATDPSEVIAKLIDLEGGQYEQLLWLFDNMYIPNVTNKDAFLEKIGVLKDAQGYYKIVDNQQIGYNSVLTDDDIDAIQRVAIWKFTNSDVYTLTATQTAWLNIITGQDEEGKDVYSDLRGIDADRNEQANLLYQYLITSAENNKGQYQDYSEQVNKITVDTQNLIKEGNNYILSTKLVNGKYLTGPIKITAENERNYDIDLSVKSNDQDVAFEYAKADGTIIEKANIKDLVGTEFYITTDANVIEKLSIAVSVVYEQTTKTLWLAGEETTNAQTGETQIVLDGEQPVMEITRTKSDPEITNFIVKPFDLALRKYITAVKSGDTVTPIDSRIPNYGDLSALRNGTTAEYKHRKDPVEVKDGDIVTYTIAIYNEGSKAGYASKIIDQLPTGLIMNNKTHGNASTVTSKDSQGNPVNTYTIEWDYLNNQLNYLNQITLTIADPANAVSLNPYTSGTDLDYETIEIECTVTQTPHEQYDTILTNVAWIAEAYDSEAQKTISSEGTLDRDSQPQTSPDVKMNNMENYKGNKDNKENLADSTYHYAGEQDDDDFEKLILKADPKEFDLALVKFIIAVSDDETITDDEYLKEADGTYSREPEVKLSQDGQLIYDFTNRGEKNPLIVEPGDYVLYTIRVYNEGEVDGYASKIRDILPDGLEFVGTNKEYNGIWDVDEEKLYNNDMISVTTDWYAQGNSYEKLLKAFDKETEISKSNPDYLDAVVLCRVQEDVASDKVLVNFAEISDDSDKDGNEIEDKDSTPDNNVPGDEDKEDDEDIEKVVVNRFDLSLRKFISSVQGVQPTDSREPNVDTTPLKQKKAKTAIYNHPKTPLAVNVGDKVVYTIRIYNEGDINGYATEIKDHLPPYLKYIDEEESEINKTYKWQISDDGRVATTRYLENTELKAFDESKQLDYADVKIECLVVDEIPINQNQTNIAEIAKYKYKQNEVINDSDSIGNSMEDLIPTDEKLPDYKKDEINKKYVPGNEDDDDFEKIYVKQFDLALRKFITKIQNEEITTRVPQVDITPLNNGGNTATYTHPKDALIVHVGDVVIYTLRIYNEGQRDGYASEITDDIPEYLEFLPEDSTNVEYMWKMYDKDGKETENIEEAVTVKTEYLSKENGEKNLIKAFDGKTLDYKDIQIAFKVKDPNSNTYIITNHAQISEDTDENGNAVKDNDSDTEAWNDGEDDQDIENVKVQYFDLSILKFVSKVIMIEDGKQTITETGYNGHEDPEPVVKVELHKKKLDKVIVKFGYGITVTNEGDIPGYATELTDYVPEGLKFEPADNPEWTDEGNNVISTRQLEDKLLQPGESATVEVIFTWINSKDNLAQKTNTVEISEDKNEYDVPDRDSTPDNKKEGEDDIDIAKVILAISTGAAKTYFTLTLGLLTIVLVGVVLIKKFVI